MGGLLGGGGPKQTTTDSTTTEQHYQQGQYDNLLSGADSWLSNAQNASNPNYINQMGQALGQQGQHYMNVLSGQVDRSALNNSLQAQADAMNTQLSRGKMRDIGLTSTGQGSSNSSRRSIAEGVAIGDANAALAQQNANTVNQFEQQQMQNQMQAAAGMNQVMGSLGQLQGLAQANTPEAQRLKQLMAYQQMISGNMGGTTNATSTSTEMGGSGGGGLGGLIGGIAGSFFGPAGTALGGAAGNALFGGGEASSDEKLKKKIKKKKDKKGKKIKTKDGIDTAEWEWNDKAEKEYGLKGKASGVIAQEAEKKRPDAVRKDKKGNRVVNYGALM